MCIPVTRVHGRGSLPAPRGLAPWEEPDRVVRNLLMADVTVMAPAFSLTLLLLSPVMHWGVLINTNGGYGCEEGIQTLISEVFAHRKLCDAYTYAWRGSEAPTFTP